MSEMIPVKKLYPGAQLPRYGTEFSAGADLFACLEAPVTLEPGQTRLISVGFQAELPRNVAGLIFARSGLASKKGLAPANKVGVVDPDYRGEWFVPLHNHSPEPQTVCHGERIAQLVLVPFLQGQFAEAETLSDTVRGAGGFGSTGV